VKLWTLELNTRQQFNQSLWMNSFI